MGKNKKEHRKKVQKRNMKITEQKRKMNKFQLELGEMIRKEIEAGKFENNKSLSNIDESIIEEVDSEVVGDEILDSESDSESSSES